MDRKLIRLNIIYAKCFDVANKNRALAMALTLYCCLDSEDGELRKEAIEIMERSILEIIYNINLTTGSIKLSEDTLKNKNITAIALMSNDMHKYKI